MVTKARGRRKRASKKAQASSSGSVDTYWLNPERLSDAHCLHAVAVGDEKRDFKGIELSRVTPLTKAATLMLEALELVWSALDTYEAPSEIVDKVKQAIEAAKDIKLK